MSDTALRAWERVERLFHEANMLAPSEQAAFLDSACAGDAALRAEVESLLCSADAQTGAVFVDRAVNVGSPVGPGAELAAGTLLGAYRVVRLIGRGGMGEVYLAERSDGKFKKQVAAKLLRAEAGEHHARFEAERQILARLEHPGIAQLLDSGTTEGGRPYILMEYVAGRPLLEHCRTLRLGLVERLALFARICDAVSFAHANLVVHRDLKSGNILVTPDGMVKLLDFGVAKLLESGIGESTHTAAPLTPDHAAPEQLQGRPVTTATDVYALGIVLYELLGGASPWAHLRVLPIAKALPRLLEEEPKQVSATAAENPDAPVPPRALAGDLDAIVAKALRKRAADRYASVADFSRDLQRHLDGEPVLARPAGTLYRLSRFAWRNRRGLRISAAIAFAALLAWQWVLHQRAQREHEITIEKIVEKGRLELLDHHEARAAVYLNQAYKMGYDTSALRFMLHQAMLPIEALTNVRIHHAGYDMYRSATFSADGKRFLLGAIIDEGGKRRAVMKIYDGATGIEQVELPEAPQLPLVIEFLPDGNHLLVTGFPEEQFPRDNEGGNPVTCIWDFTSPSKFVKLAGMNGVAGQPLNPEGSRLLIAAKSGLEVHDARSGRLIKTLAQGRAITATTYSPDGRSIALADAKGGVEIISDRGDATLKRLAGSIGLTVKGLVYTPGGDRLLAVSDGGDIRIWELSTGLLTVAFAADSDWVRDLRFNLDGRRLLTVGSGGYKVWSATRGILLLSIPQPLDKAYANSAALSQDGDTLIAASAVSSQAEAWDVLSKRKLYSLDLHASVITGAVFDVEGKRLLLAARDGQAEIWRMPIKPAWKYESFETLPYAARFDRAGNRLLVTGGDFSNGSVALFDLATGQVAQRFNGHKSVVRDGDFSPSEEKIVTASQDGSAGIWDVAHGSRIAVLDQSPREIFSARFSPDGRRILTMTNPSVPNREDAAELWDTDSGQRIAILAHDGLVLAARFDPSSTRVATAGVDRTVKIWAAHDGQLLRTMTGHRDAVRSVEFEQDGRHLLTAAEDDTVRIWDSETGQALRSLERPGLGIPAQAVFSPDERSVAIATESGSVHLWFPESNKLLTLKGHQQQVDGLRFTPDGSLLFSYGDDGTARAWDPGTGLELGVIAVHEKPINSLDLSRDATQMATVSWGQLELSSVALEARPATVIADVLRCGAPWVFSEADLSLSPSSALASEECGVPNSAPEVSRQ